MKKKDGAKNGDRKITSPSQLNECIRVASGGSWLLLTAVLLLLVGISVWGIFGRLDTKVRASVVVRGGVATAYVSDGEIADIEPGEEILFNGGANPVLSVSRDPICVDDTFQDYIRYVGGFEYGDWVRTVDAGASDAPDGVYYAEIVTDSRSPISFLLN